MRKSKLFKVMSVLSPLVISSVFAVSAIGATDAKIQTSEVVTPTSVTLSINSTAAPSVVQEITAQNKKQNEREAALITADNALDEILAQEELVIEELIIEDSVVAVDLTKTEEKIIEMTPATVTYQAGGNTIKQTTDGDIEITPLVETIVPESAEIIVEDLSVAPIETVSVEENIEEEVVELDLKEKTAELQSNAAELTDAASSDLSEEGVEQVTDGIEQAESEVAVLETKVEEAEEKSELDSEEVQALKITLAESKKELAQAKESLKVSKDNLKDLEDNYGVLNSAYCSQETKLDSLTEQVSKLQNGTVDNSLMGMFAMMMQSQQQMQQQNSMLMQLMMANNMGSNQQDFSRGVNSSDSFMKQMIMGQRMTSLTDLYNPAARGGNVYNIHGNYNNGQAPGAAGNNGMFNLNNNPLMQNFNLPAMDRTSHFYNSNSNRVLDDIRYTTPMNLAGPGHSLPQVNVPMAPQMMAPAVQGPAVQAPAPVANVGNPMQTDASSRMN